MTFTCQHCKGAKQFRDELKITGSEWFDCGVCQGEGGFTSIPTEVVICGVPYSLTIAEEMAVFKHRIGPGTTRVAWDRRCGCWYVRISKDYRGQEDESPAVMAGHIVQMAEVLALWFGGDHEFLRGEYQL